VRPLGTGNVQFSDGVCLPANGTVDSLFLPEQCDILDQEPQQLLALDIGCHSHDLLGEKGTAWAWHLNDGLGSVRQLTGGNGDVTLTQGYTPFGLLLWQEGDAATAYGFTGEQQDPAVALVFLRARYYDPATGRFLSKDPFPGYAAWPQTLNRFIYAVNSPINFADPSGYDLMIVGGWSNNNWNYPEEWKEWIKVYKGWNEEQWKSFDKDWTRAVRNNDDANRRQLMEEHKIYFFQWSLASGSQWPHTQASRRVPVDDAVAELYNQLYNLKDITLMGHSKGGNLVLSFLQRLNEFDWNKSMGFEQPKNAILVDALTNPVFTIFTGLFVHGENFCWDWDSWGGRPSVAGSPVNIINIYNAFDPVNTGYKGSVKGAWNKLVWEPWPLWDIHSTKGHLAEEVLIEMLQVQWDRGASQHVPPPFETNIPSPPRWYELLNRQIPGMVFLEGGPPREW